MEVGSSQCSVGEGNVWMVPWFGTLNRDVLGKKCLSGPLISNSEQRCFKSVFNSGRIILL